MIYPKAAFHSDNVNPRFLFFFLFVFSSPGFAGDVEIVDAKADCDNNVCRFDVTLSHADTGWEHYADGWRVITEDGQELGNRVLMHPHVNEQPFTRSLSGVKIPATVKTVWIEAHDSVHGTSSNKYKLDLSSS